MKNAGPGGSWSGNASGGQGWGDSTSYMGNQISSCIVLKNLTPQLEGNLLHTLCSQHGPVVHFMLNSALGKAFVKYRSLDEAAKAQQNLNKCSLANTTITAEFVPEQEVARFLEQGGSAPNQSSGNQPNNSIWGGSGNAPAGGSGHHGGPQGGGGL